MTRSTLRRLAVTLGPTLMLAVAMLGPASAAGAPRGVHVALGADAHTSATITWFTDGLDDPGTSVSYGPTAALGSTATGTAAKTPGVDALTHEVALSALASGSEVYYQVADGPIRSFKTAPTGRTPFRFAAFGDIGVSAQAARAVSSALAQNPDLTIIPGDLSYANGNAPVWDTWFDRMEPLAATRPLMTAPGNHDSQLESGSGAYEARFAQPGAEYYYSFDYANVHFLILHSTAGTAATQGLLPGMIAFAETDLADAAARKATGEIDFIAVVQHHPLYGNQDAGLLGVEERNTNPPLIAIEEPMLQAYDVDLLIAAHNHHFERSKPMVASQPSTSERTNYVDPVGYVEIITGGGGQSLYAFKDQNDIASWSASYAKCFHIMSVSVDGKTLRADAISTDDNCFIKGNDYPAGSIIDTFSITRS